MKNDKELRTRDEILRALEIMLLSVDGARDQESGKIPAMAALTLAWVLDWEPSGTIFQDMIDECNKRDAESAIRKPGHRKKRSGAGTAA